MKRLICLAICLLAFAPASALTLKDNPGGEILKFADMFEAAERSGERVVIEGYCVSACALVTALVPAKQVCVKDAVFGFHSAWHLVGKKRVFSPEATAEMWRVYPKKVKAEILAQGWNGLSKQETPIYVPGEKLYRKCKK